MKINELITDFSIHLTNEEKRVLDELENLTALNSFEEREQFIINDLIRKSVVKKLNRKNEIMVIKNGIE